ncbi:MAG TPA: hypothetical protein VFB43_15945 [Terracidiphilus sp.]|jgi:hypothetical protein|nr:hypothetical protein [Terracidiphilus sp.]
MQTSPPISSSMATKTPDELQSSRHVADRIYQGVTLAAMLLLLVSLWVF